ncbi:MAG: TonB-dependent receptor plug domain-containing protein [Terriglobales bacterium]
MLSLRKTAHLCLLLAAGALPIGAAGQTSASPGQQNTPLKQLTLEQLGNIEVTSVNKQPEQVWNTAAAIYVITQADIERSGATSIADALRVAPGVEVSRISSTTWAIGIRGLQSNFSKSVLVLIDGRSVYTPLFSGVYWDVQDVVLEDVDRIEVIRGPGGIIWGPNAVNGVINIITKNSSQTHGVLASALGGNVDRTIDELRVGSGSGNFHYRVFGKGFIRAHEFHQDGNDFDDWHQYRGGFRTDYDRGKDSFSFQGDIYRGDSPHLIGTDVTDDTVDGGNLNAQWNRNYGGGNDFHLQAYFDRTIRTGLQLGETRNTYDIDFVDHLRVGSHNNLSLGGGLRWSPNRFIQKQPSIDLIPHDETDHIYTGFLQDELHLAGNKLSLIGGVKFQHNNFSGFDIQPTGRVLWNPTPHQSVWAAVTRAVTTPSRIEEDFVLDAKSPGLEIQVLGNPNFKSEALVGYEFGYRQLFSKSLYVDLSAFHNHYTDLQSFGAAQTSLVLTPPPHLLISIPYNNLISGNTNGIEIAPSWQVTPFWMVSGSYSYVGLDLKASGPTSDISSTGTVSKYEGSTPHQMVEFRSYIDLPKSFEFDQVFRGASALPAQKVADYQTLDLQAAWTFRSQLRIAVVGQNLLHEHHDEWGTGDPTQQNIGIRRAAYLKITWTSKAK